MNSLDYQNLIVEHRYNVAKLINSDEISALQRLKLLRYAESLKKNINDLSTRITIQFEIDETMAMQGSCWLMHKPWWEKVIGELQTEGYGPHYHDSHEMVFKTWKAGGKFMLNKNTWFAHKTSFFPSHT